ncbi:UNVERIFIED_CONTAM: hypothetical protein K2H54_040126 [Gekko kuhli]
MNVERTVPGDAGAGPGQASLNAMKNPLGPACIFLRKGIAEKQGERELGADEIEGLVDYCDQAKEGKKWS